MDIKVSPNVIKTEDDLYFRIANLLLSKTSSEKITVDQIAEEMKSKYKIEVDGDLQKQIQNSINALVETGKLEERARFYEIKENKENSDKESPKDVEER